VMRRRWIGGGGEAIIASFIRFPKIAVQCCGRWTAISLKAAKPKNGGRRSGKELTVK